VQPGKTEGFFTDDGVSYQAATTYLNLIVREAKTGVELSRSSQPSVPVASRLPPTLHKFTHLHLKRPLSTVDRT
jgi:hypothetical protein